MLPFKGNESRITFVLHAAGPYEISCSGESGGNYVWKDCGLRINFPSRCSQQHVGVTVSTFLPIKNEIYPGVYIVSAVYQFNCDIERFDKMFTLHLQHFVKLKSPEDCEKMHFVVVQDDNSDVKYGGHFETGKSYGTVTLDRFCYIFIGWFRDHLWKPVCMWFRPSSDDQENVLQQAPRNWSHNNRRSVALLVQENSTSQIHHIGSSQSASEQQLDSSEAVSPSSSMGDVISPTYKYEAMISTPKTVHRLTNKWSSYYSIYHKDGTWRQVCI